MTLSVAMVAVNAAANVPAPRWGAKAMARGTINDTVGTNPGTAKWMIIVTAAMSKYTPTSGSDQPPIAPRNRSASHATAPVVCSVEARDNTPPMVRSTVHEKRWWNRCQERPPGPGMSSTVKANNAGSAGGQPWRLSVSHKARAAASAAAVRFSAGLQGPGDTEGASAGTGSPGPDGGMPRARCKPAMK